MKRQIKTLLTLAAMLFVNQFSFAGATEDLWAALKGANYPNALTAIAAGADVNNLDKTFGTPLNFASCWADASVVKTLIDAKSDVNFIAPANKFTPIMNAAQWGNTEAVKLLLAAGSDLKVKNIIGQTVLATAVIGAKLEIVKMITDAGADPNEKFKVGATELNLLVSMNQVKSPEEEIVYIQTVSKSLASLGVTFPNRLKNAKANDYSTLEDLTKYLLDKGLSPNQTIGGTWGSLIFQSTELGKTGVALALINAKADMEVTGMIKGEHDVLYNVTPIMMASLKGNNELVEALCKAGANVNFVSTQMESGSKVNVGGNLGSMIYWKTTTKNTALSLATANGHPDTAALLQKYGGLGPKDVKKK